MPGSVPGSPGTTGQHADGESGDGHAESGRDRGTAQRAGAVPSKRVPNPARDTPWQHVPGVVTLGRGALPRAIQGSKVCLPAALMKAPAQEVADGSPFRRDPVTGQASRLVNPAPLAGRPGCGPE